MCVCVHTHACVCVCESVCVCVCGLLSKALAAFCRKSSCFLRYTAAFFKRKDVHIPEEFIYVFYAKQ